jgi:hypothetical protein
MECWHLPYTDHCIKEIGNMKRELNLRIPEFNHIKEEREAKYFDRQLTAEKHEFVKLFQHFMEVQRYSERQFQPILKLSHILLL